MIDGIGIDVVDIARFAESLERTPSLREKLFTPAEASKPTPSLAARFAAKEAFFKALGTGWRGSMGFNEVEISNDELGKPSIKLLGEAAKIMELRNIKSIHVSLSHTSEMAMATVIIE